MKKIYEVPNVSVAKLETLNVIVTSNDAGKSSIPKGEWTDSEITVIPKGEWTN